MENIGPMKLVKLGALVLSTMMLMAFLVPTPTAEASASSESPCPHWSIQAVLDNPNGNWDHDLVNNVNELYNGLDPCTVDTSAFCNSGGNPLCLYPTYVYVSYSSACLSSITAYPTADYDGDGVSNNAEILNGADPCAHPCPNWTSADLALNPNGSWDFDGVSNAIEVNQGTNPCNGYSYSYNPCPYYSLAQVSSMPGYDWDGDGVSNSAEVQRGTSPCSYDAVRYVYQAPQRLPHVNTRPVYVPPTPPAPVCPYGYPYYHPGNGLCYANPVGHFYSY